MPGNELLIDGFGRIREIVHDVLDGLAQADLDYRVDGSANSIGWLIWHLTRVQDDHIAGAAVKMRVHSLMALRAIDLAFEFLRVMSTRNHFETTVRLLVVQFLE